jgi:adenylate kinase
MLTAAGSKLDRVVEITVDHDEVVARLVRRAAEQGRTDDNESVVRRRLEIYTDETAPLAQLYAERGLLVQVNGAGEIDEVTERLLAAVG